MINPRQQGRYHVTVNVARAKLRELNVDDGTGVRYADVEDSFVENFDEECVAAADNCIKVIGSASAPKHEKENGGRTTMTMLKVIGANGDVGPCYALMAGATPRPGYDGKMMEKFGAAAGSSIVMTPTGFMTDSAFDELAEDMARGVRAMPVICEHPTWWVLATADGFHAHKMTLKAQQVFRDHKIMLIIEEGDSSHCNQAFDRAVAKHGKSVMRASLDITTRHRVFSGQVDQYGLLLIALGGIRRLKEDPDIIRSSFKSVNMLFSCRLGLEQWLKKISGFLIGGAKFQDEGVVTPRSLLPEWYTQWPEERKQGALDIVSNGNGWTDVEMVKALRDYTGLGLQDLAAYQTCWFVETSGPSIEDIDPVTAPARAQTVNPNSDLSVFSLKPKGLTGPELFSHMVKFRLRMARPTTRNYDLGHADYLDLGISQRVEVFPSGKCELVSDQLRATMPTQDDLTEGAIMREVGTKTASIRMAQRQLNSLGEVNAYCVYANHPDRIKKLKGIMELAASIDEMKSVDVAVKKTKATETMESLLIHVPPGMKILRADFSKHAEMTVNQMKGIAHKYMKRTLKGKNKQQFADAFAAARDELGWKLREFVERACPDTGNGTRYYECTAGKFTTWALPEDGKVIPNVP